MKEIVHIDDCMSICGYGTNQTNVNNGYGCLHPDNEEYEKVYKDSYGYYQLADSSTKEPTIKMGKCYSFSCPLYDRCCPDDLEKYDKDLYEQYLSDFHQSQYSDFCDFLLDQDLMIKDK